MNKSNDKISVKELVDAWLHVDFSLFGFLVAQRKLAREVGTLPRSIPDKSSKNDTLTPSLDTPSKPNSRL